MMGWSYFSRILIVSVLLLSSFSHGFGRKLLETVELENSLGPVEFENSLGPVEEGGGISRMMIEEMDYAPPKANENPRAEFIFSPPPQP